MLTRDFVWKTKSLGEAGTFTGYASTYNNVDLVGDIVEPGAFKQAIAQQGKGYPLLWVHNQAEPLGLAKLSDSKTGLVVDGELLLADPAAQRVHLHMKAGSIKGLSIGYSVPLGEGKVTYSDDGTRTLKEVFIHEISLCAVAANPRAQVVSVKSLGDVRRVLHLLRDGDIDDDAISELRQIDRELKRLLIADPAETKSEMLRELQSFAAELKSLAA